MISSFCFSKSSLTRVVGRRVARGTTRNQSLKSCVIVGSNGIRSFAAKQSRLLYSTERIVELRSGKRGDQLPKTLYNSNNERDNCGVGLIASLKSIPSRGIVEKADEMLVRMAHRGGCGCDPASGDGSGMYNLFCKCCS